MPAWNLQSLLEFSWRGQDPIEQIARSIVLIVGVLAVRAFVTRTILRLAPQSEIRRRWIVGVRNYSVMILALGLGAVWFKALETFGTLILGLGVAFVIATKELIQCMTGSFLRTVANTYNVGDRIEINNFRGDVIDVNLFTTTLLEVGPGRSMHLRTGRTIVVPNIKMLDSTVVNESFMRQYVLHVFSVPVKLSSDWKKAEQALLEAAEAESAEFLEEARSYMETLERSHGLRGLPVQPRTLLQLNDPDKVTILVRTPAPVGRQGAIEQAILRRYLDQIHPPDTEVSAQL
ncbi:MAG: mechanosensitive ion channel [Acidobacteria bacterium]|nr:mechanosensitive ion channel [Acidobacteriota bacterium]